MSQTTLIALTFLVTAALPAQRLTAHPQDSLLFAGASFAPFGVFPFGTTYAEGRTQLLIPAAELPGAGAILTGLETSASSISSGVSFNSLQISVAPTSATNLSMDFGTNLSSGATIVMPAISGVWIPTTGSWTAWNFTNSYVHDGTSALVIDIVKVTWPCNCMLSTAVNSYPARNDRPVMIHAHGNAGSGAATATTATATEEAIGVRLRWQAATTLRSLSDAAAPGSNQFALGEDFSLTLQGDTGQLWSLAWGNGFLPTPVAIPGLDGSLHLSGLVLSTFGVVGATSDAVVTMTIPSQSTLVGLYLTWQGAVWNQATGRFMLTNGVDHFINA